MTNSATCSALRWYKTQRFPSWDSKATLLEGKSSRWREPPGRSQPWDSGSCRSSLPRLSCSSTTLSRWRYPWVKLKMAPGSRTSSPRCWATRWRKTTWPTQTWPKPELQGWSWSPPIRAFGGTWGSCRMDCPSTREEPTTATRSWSTETPGSSRASPSWGGTPWGAWWDAFTDPAGRSRTVLLNTTKLKTRKKSSPASHYVVT